MDHNHAIGTLRLWGLLLLLCTAGSYQFAAAQTTSGGGFTFTPTGSAAGSTSTTVNVNVTYPTYVNGGGLNTTNNSTGGTTGGGIDFTPGGYGTAASPTSTSAASPLCVVLTQNLGPGMQDASSTSSYGDIARLQAFLAQTPSVYPEGIINGSYGPATQRAVQRWQKLHGVITFGSPSTTGYGAVGARTRALMAQGCAGAPKLPTGLPALVAYAISDNGTKVSYTNMPSGAKFVFMSVTSGARFDPKDAVTVYDDHGSVDMTFNSNMLFGSYVVRALSSDENKVYAQGNVFFGGKHINNYAAAIDPASLTENLPQPTISGSANVSSVGIAIYTNGSKVYGSGSLPVTNGRWSVTVTPALGPGSYQVWVYSPENVLLTTGTLNITYR